MKPIKKLLLVLALALSFVSCEKEPQFQDVYNFEEYPDSVWVTDYFTVKQYSGGKLINEWKAKDVTRQSYGYSVKVNNEWFEISGDIVITEERIKIKR